MRISPLRVGVFVAPYHALDESPALTFERDLQLASFADELGVSEFWFGEHHSGGYEMSSSPELMIAAAAQRTKRIKLGTGVVSLPYHNPLMTANRLAQLDNLTFGRLIFGAGPGLLPGDAHMIGIDPRESREKLDEGLFIITRLLAGEWVTEKSSWFDLHDAHCQVLPYQGSLEVCVASTFSPNGGVLAAKYNAGMLCMTSTVYSGGYDALSGNWNVAVAEAKKANRAMSPSVVRCATIMHLAETKDEAFAQVRRGFGRYQQYVANQLGSRPGSAALMTLEEMVERNEVVVGTPEDAVKQIKRLEEKIPDFGCLLLFENDWARTEDAKRSLEILARYVLPEINQVNRNRTRSYEWSGANRDHFGALAAEGTRRAVEKHKPK